MMFDENGNGKENKKRKYFCIYIILFFSIAFVIVYVSSWNQVNVKRKNEEIQNQLVAQKTFSQDIQSNVRELSEENSRLKTETDEKQKTIDTLKQEVERLKQLHPNYLENLDAYEQLKAAYAEQDKAKCQELLAKITVDLIPDKELENFNNIKTELSK